MDKYPLEKKTPTVQQLSKKYKISVDEIKKRLKKGADVESEHTSDEKTAQEIALDHLGEDLFYYEKLKKIEERYIHLKKMLIG